MPRMRWRPGLCPEPAGGAHDAPPGSVVGWGVAPLPKNPTPLGVSILALSALAAQAPRF